MCVSRTCYASAITSCIDVPIGSYSLCVHTTCTSCVCVCAISITISSSWPLSVTRDHEFCAAEFSSVSALSGVMYIQ